MRSALAVVLLAGCTMPDEAGPLEVEKEIRMDFPVAINRDLDLLFVIDDSPTMADDQATLATNLPLFMTVLETIEGGLPNVHIGVVSTDGGGALRVGDEACRPEGAPYLVDVAERDGGRTVNYPGTLPEAFVCNAALGASDGEHRQHLRSMQGALEADGFVRDDAYLGIVIVTDGDDASPGEVDAYADVLVERKGDRDMVLVSVIAAAAPRLEAFAEEFPNRYTFTPIDGPDLSDGMSLFAEMVKTTLGVPCVDGDLVEPYECVVSELFEGDETLVPHCDDAGLPCWRLVEDVAACYDTPTQLTLEIERSGVSVPAGTYVQLRCRTE
jgi:hypothetical protein